VVQLIRRPRHQPGWTFQVGGLRSSMGQTFTPSLRTRITAEERYGVPAAALVAMAIAESGYGWTRLAINTDNLFAWKHFPGPAMEGHRFWVLKGQSD
jgi:flagellum-specific peptidoglycan hydrolase FlgJ